MLNRRGETEATEKAERRKKRKKMAAQAQNRPVGLWLDNTAGTAPVSLRAGDTSGGNCCRNNAIVVPAGGRLWVGFNRSRGVWPEVGAIWMTGPDPERPRYWLNFTNPNFGLPSVSAAANGQPNLWPFSQEKWCCFPYGNTALRVKELNVNEMVNVTISGRVFNVRRNKDTNYKVFTVILPANL